MTAGTLIIRLAVGGLFVGHGLQKLRGSFDGPGLDGTTQMMESLEMHPARRNAVAAALTETVGGAALALGAATPVAAAGITATMITAVRKVHWNNGLWNAGGGWEFNGVLVAAATAVVADGPGLLSVDALVGKRKWGLGWAIASVVAGAVASTVLIEAGRRASAEDGSGDSGDDSGDGAGRHAGPPETPAAVPVDDATPELPTDGTDGAS